MSRHIFLLRLEIHQADNLSVMVVAIAPSGRMNPTSCGGSAMLPDGAGLLFSHQTGPRTHLLALDHTVFFVNDAKKR
jgi:hypothetical protein